MNPETVTPTERMIGEDEEETEQLKKMLEEARAYLLGFKWCRSITREFFGLGVGGVVSVFLFEIDSSSHADQVLWVIVGDLPSAYLVTDNADDPCAALRVYCELMDEWILAIRSGAQLSEVFPVAAAPTTQNADLLEKRIAFLRTELMPAFC